MIISSNGQEIIPKELPKTTSNVIYLALHKESKKVYIGRTVQKFINRKNAHGYSLDKKKGHFANALKCYGVDSFEWYIIDVATSEELPLLEEKYIKYYESYGEHGYNSTIGGEISPFEMKEVKEKMIALYPMIAEKLKGKKRTPEQCKKISQALSGKKHSEERRLANSLGQKNRVYTEEEKHRISHANIGKKFDDEWKKNMSNGAKERWKRYREQVKECKYGHEFNDENTKYINGCRRCRACEKERTRRYRENLK